MYLYILQHLCSRQNPLDLKVKVDPEPSVGWSRCLDIIEEAAKKEEQKAEADDTKDVD